MALKGVGSYGDPMVQSGSESTMLGQWRVVIKQAEEAGRAGRLDEALALLGREDVAEYRQAVQLRGRLTLDLVEHTLRRAAADDVEGAVSDLNLAEAHGAAPDVMATARHKVADRVAEELRLDFEAGDPGRVIEQAARWAGHRLAGPSLRRLSEAAESWARANGELRRGEFSRAREELERAERLTGEAGTAALGSLRREVEERQERASPRIERLYEQIAGGKWSAILAAAEAVLELVPEHQVARQSRAQAWRQVGALTSNDGLYRRNNPTLSVVHPLMSEQRPATGREIMDEAARGVLGQVAKVRVPEETRGSKGRFLLWADSIGGYLACLGSELVLGRAAHDGEADIPLLGDLSRRHATIVRSGDGYVIRAHHSTFVNGRRVEEASLKHGDVIRLGTTVELEFRQPSPVSTTAMLEIMSRHRLPLAVDGIILMGETCIMGSTNQAHIRASELDSPVVLYRQGGELWCRAPGEFEVDGRPFSGRSRLNLNSSVLGDGFSFSLEPLPEKGERI